jgi:hypothetical protein
MKCHREGRARYHRTRGWWSAETIDQLVKERVGAGPEGLALVDPPNTHRTGRTRPGAVVLEPTPTIVWTCWPRSCSPEGCEQRLRPNPLLAIISSRYGGRELAGAALGLGVQAPSVRFVVARGDDEPAEVAVRE